MKLGLVTSKSTDPYYNLALERYLLETVENDQVILYLWQNEHTVVIGRNQSALAECRVQELTASGGKLARRLSGGGAVYHDLGNLNFTFIMPSVLYNEARQTHVVLHAVQMLDLHAERTGRNDLLINGAKFSGHAYYHTKGKSYHHGTLLVNTDMQKLSAYLNPSPLKLAAKGVSSVKSRVCNLESYIPGLTCDLVAQAMVLAFEEMYGGEAQNVELSEESCARIRSYEQNFASHAWLFRNEHVLENSREAKFDWGMVRIDWALGAHNDAQNKPQNGAQTEAGCPTLGDVALYSDSLDADFLALAPEALRGCPANADDLIAALEYAAWELPESPYFSRDACINDIVSLIA